VKRLAVAVVCACSAHDGPPPVSNTTVTVERDAQPAPFIARIQKVEVSGSIVLVTIAAGTEQGIDHNWRAFLVRETVAIDGGELIIIRVDKRTTVAKSTLTFDQIPANLRVRFDPP